MRSRLPLISTIIVMSITFSSPQLFAADADLPRHPAPAPDGSRIAFSWQGDIWLVPATGGQARRLTAHPADERFPIWSRDGDLITFASNRAGNFDLFVMATDGSSPPRRLTHASGDDLPLDFTIDGEHVLFTSSRAESIRWMEALYTVPVRGGTPSLAQDALGEGASFSPRGDQLVFVRGSTSWSRHGYRGSANRELWLRAADGGYARLTDFDGDDDCPTWINDTTIAFRSARSERKNLFLIDTSSHAVTQLTNHQGTAIRFPRAAADGSIIAYEHEDAIWTVPATGGEPVKLTIDVPPDYVLNPLQRCTAKRDAESLAISPDGELAAFVVHGDVFVTAIMSKDDQQIAKPPTVQVTATPSRESDVSWSIDGKSLLFTSTRNGNNDLFLAHPVDDKAGWLESFEFPVEALTDSPAEEHSARFSPSSERIAFIRGKGNLVVMQADGSDEKVLLEHWSSLDYDWSPDGEWIAYSVDDMNHNSEVWIIPATGGPAYNVSRHPDIDYGPRWSPDGRSLVWLSKRHADTYDVWGVWLTRADHDRTPAEWLKLWQAKDDPKKKKKGKKAEDDEGSKGEENGKEEDEENKPELANVTIELDGLWRRVRSLTDELGDESQALLSDDGKTLLFTAEQGDDRDLFKLEWGADKIERLTKGGEAPVNVQLDRKGKTIFYLNKDGAIKRINLEGKPGDPTPFMARYEVDRRVERKVVFEEAWRALNEWFYDPQMHGIDWQAMRETYRPWALKASTEEDFADVMNLMLGELNASHMGYRKRSEGGEQTGWLGVTFDATAGGPGLLVSEVLRDSPADRSQVGLRPGERIIAVNGRQVLADTNIYELLADTVDQRLPLTVLNAEGKERRAVVIPINYRRLHRLRYQQWVDQRRDLVEQYSQGRLGYLHIQAMSFPSFERFERDLYAAGYGKEGLIIDVRSNGGGSTTDYMMAVLNVRRHAYTVPRDAYPETRAYPQGRLPLAAWTRPAMTICNEDSYSNAEIFSHAFMELERGLVVGYPTFGAVISTGGTRLLNGASVRLPMRGWYVAGSGMNMENNGAVPDIVIEQPPAEDTSHDTDTQLNRAVEIFLERIADDPRAGAW
jgi:tricorn protease